MTARLLHVGPVIVDIVMAVDALPRTGEGVFASSARTQAGGGFNVIAAAARAGMDVVYAGAHGSGPHGDLVRAALRSEGAGVAHARRPDADTGFCVALVDGDAERSFVTRLGAEMDLSLTELRALRPAPGDFVYTVGYSLLPGPRADELLTWVGDLPEEVRLVLDPAPVVGDIPQESLERALARVDVLSLSAGEAAAVTGHARPEEAAAHLVPRIRPGGVVVVRDSAAGCVVAGRDGTAQRVPGFAVQALDTTGAGDAHVGVFTAALAAGLSPRTAAYRANAAAALAVTRRGSATAPTSAETDAFLAESVVLLF
ncbi:sugar/nucleoside kinase (ribokinase family) [Nocardiopsis sp. Huas11]|uniref:PfkB family carbohydrate kinase n=1 Tax=Nocardiopsis sp. Huas11 TaxID=2183912 RepID=UPI000EAFBA83|nr:PfkB family carbohydrate kinase [Nocardiopsis sp. Huas11]RKS09378.1 sugar/nucleoside kinase (ribokinase family) [Nocardiopsis sp. Huas11]